MLQGIVARFINRLRRRFTVAGLAVLVGLIISAGLGVDTNRTMAYQIFTILLSLLLISGVFSLFWWGKFSALRKLPRYGTVGEKFEYEVVIKNFTGKKQHGLYVLENVESSGTDLFESNQRHLRKKRGVQEGRRTKKKKIPQHVYEKELPPLTPLGTSEVRIRITPSRRGYLILKKLMIARPDPLNLIKSSQTLMSSQLVLILPKRYSLPHFELPGSRRYQPGGVSLTHSVGDSEEFASLREYRPGDPRRRIHWRSWAKTGKPIVKEFEEEFFVRQALILDTFQDEMREDLFEDAVSLAASFVCTVQTQEALLDLMFVGTEAFCFTTGRGTTSTDRILEILAGVKPCLDQPFAALTSLVQDRIALLSGCICIFLAWDKERAEFIALLDAMKIPNLVFVINTTQEQDSWTLSKQEGSRTIHYLTAGKIEEDLAGL